MSWDDDSRIGIFDCRHLLETALMTRPIDSSASPHAEAAPRSVEMPRATAWPIVLALGITLLGAGLVTNLALSLVGTVLFAFGLGGWIGQLLPGRGHAHELLVEPAYRSRPIAEKPGMVDHLRPGMAGHRFQVPEKVHPISAGVKGGLVGGLVMPIPALAYGVISGHGIWFPINLLAGMAVPGISGATESRRRSMPFRRSSSSVDGDHADLLAALPLQRHPGGRVKLKRRGARSRG